MSLRFIGGSLSPVTTALNAQNLSPDVSVRHRVASPPTRPVKTQSDQACRLWMVLTLLESRQRSFGSVGLCTTRLHFVGQVDDHRPGIEDEDGVNLALRPEERW